MAKRPTCILEMKMVASASQSTVARFENWQKCSPISSMSVGTLVDNKKDANCVRH